MVCPTCGVENDPSSTVCARCNTALADVPTAPLAPAPPTGRYGPGPRSSSRLPLIAGLSVVVLIAVIALVVVLYRPNSEGDPGDGTGAGDVLPATTQPATTEPAATEPEQPEQDGSAPEQAAAIDAVLSESVASRRKLNDAIQRIGQCTDLRAAVADMREVGAERQAQIETVRRAELSALSEGEQIRSELITALQYAWQADQGFLGWAEPTTTSGCGNTSSRKRAYSRGRAASDHAGAAKRAFLARWNPVAVGNGLSARSADDI